MSDTFREVAVDRETGGVAIYWFTPGGRLRRIDLARHEAFKALAQLALGLAETEADAERAARHAANLAAYDRHGRERNR